MQSTLVPSFDAVLVTSLLLLVVHSPTPVWSFFLTDGNTVLRTPDSYFARLGEVGYPWQPKYTTFQPDGYPVLRMHYLDEGPPTATETILLLHGTPVWSYLYRWMIPVLLDKGYRVIAPDFIGCGRSDKLLKRERYNHQLHVDTLLHLIDTLDLTGITMVGQDLGGPIGSSAVYRRPDRFKRLVYFNTWLPMGDVFDSFGRFLQYIPYLGVRLMTLALNYFQSVSLMLMAVSSASKQDITFGYMAPFPDPRYQGGIAAWPLMIPLVSQDEMAVDLAKFANFVKTSWTGPTLIGYSDRERITVAGKAQLEGLFPGSCKVVIPNAGHFLQEDQGPSVAQAIAAFINGVC